MGLIYGNVVIKIAVTAIRACREDVVAIGTDF